MQPRVDIIDNLSAVARFALFTNEESLEIFFPVLNISTILVGPNGTRAVNNRK